MDGKVECLPVPPELEGNFTVKGTYTETTVSFPEGDFKKAKIDWDEGMEYLESLRKNIRAADPKNPGMTFDWKPRWEWDLVECSSSKVYPVIGETVESSSLLQEDGLPKSAQQVVQRLLALETCFWDSN